MPHHHTKNTVGALKWCSTCKRSTLHNVSGKIIGLCLEEHKAGHTLSRKQEQRNKKKEQEEKNPKFSF